VPFVSCASEYMHIEHINTSNGGGSIDEGETLNLFIITIYNVVDVVVAVVIIIIIYTRYLV
jgi:hypothetical protein